MGIDPQRCHNPIERLEVLSTLMQMHEQAIRHYNVLRPGESIGEEVAQEVFAATWATVGFRLVIWR